MDYNSVFIQYCISLLAKESKLDHRLSTAVKYYSSENTTLANIPEDDLLGHWLYVYLVNRSCAIECDAFRSYRMYPALRTIDPWFNKLIKDSEYKDKLDRIILLSPNEFNSLIFETLVAISYLRRGFGVSFVPTKNNCKTFDIAAVDGDRLFEIECKRVIDKGDRFIKFEESIEHIMTILADYAHKNHVILSVKLFIKGNFDINDFAKELARILSLGEGQYTDPLFSIDINRPSMATIDTHFEENDVVCGSPQIVKLFDPTWDSRILTKFDIRYLGTYEIPDGINMHKYKMAKGIQSGVLLQYAVFDSRMTENMARYFKRQITGALQQCSGRNVSVVHIGYESNEGDYIESVRKHHHDAIIPGIDAKNESAVCMNVWRPIISESGYIHEETAQVYASSQGMYDYMTRHPLLFVQEDESVPIKIFNGTFWDNPL